LIRPRIAEFLSAGAGRRINRNCGACGGDTGQIGFVSLFLEERGINEVAEIRCEMCNFTASVILSGSLGGNHRGRIILDFYLLSREIGEKSADVSALL